MANNRSSEFGSGEFHGREAGGCGCRAGKAAAGSAAGVLAGKAVDVAGKQVKRGASSAVAWSLVGLVQAGLTAATVVDIARRDKRRINGSKPFWYVAAFVNWVGPLAWFLGGRRLDRNPFRR